MLLSRKSFISCQTICENTLRVNAHKWIFSWNFFFKSLIFIPLFFFFLSFLVFVLNKMIIFENYKKIAVIHKITIESTFSYFQRKIKFSEFLFPIFFFFFFFGGGEKTNYYEAMSKWIKRNNYNIWKKKLKNKKDVGTMAMNCK